MATSSQFPTSNDNIVYWLECILNSQNIANNTSNVTVKVWVKRTNTGYTTYGTGTCSCTIDGNHYSAGITSDQKITSTAITLFTKTLDITHNADGAKTLAMSASINHSQFTASSHSWSYALTTIPRASSISSFPDFTIGNNVTISISRQSDSFTHDLTFKVGSTTIKSVTGVGTSYTLAAADQEPIYATIPSATSATVTLTCQTKSGSTNIGSAVSDTAKATVSSSIIPTAAFGAPTEANSTVTNVVGTGKFVRGLSKINLSISGTAQKSASITSYHIVYLNATYNGSSLTTGTINWTSTSVTGYVTDSRGRNSNTVTLNLTALAYHVPQITSFTVQRCLVDGTVNDLGTYAKIVIGANVSSLINSTEKNSIIANVYSRARGSTDWGSTKKTLTGTTSISNTSYNLSGYLADSSYEFKLTVVDKFNTTFTIILLATGIVVMSWGKEGMSAGKVYDEVQGGAFQAGGDAYVDGSLKVGGTNVVESGSNTNGTYIKYYDGTMICTKQVTQTVSTTNAWGTLFESTAQINFGAWAAAFMAIPTVFTQNVNSYSAGWLEKLSDCTATNIGTAYFCRPTSISNASITIHLVGIGRWK